MLRLPPQIARENGKMVKKIYLFFLNCEPEGHGFLLLFDCFFLSCCIFTKKTQSCDFTLNQYLEIFCEKVKDKIKFEKQKLILLLSQKHLKARGYITF